VTKKETMQDFKNEIILSFDLAFITDAAQEQILEVPIRIKRMLGGLLARLGWGRVTSSTCESGRARTAREGAASRPDRGTDS
jgi:hypothetical protein